MSDNKVNSKFFTRETENSNISSSSIVKYYKLKNSDTIEATIMSKKIIHKSSWVKLNKTEMVNKETGEVKKMRKNTNRSNNISGIKRSQKCLVRLIQHNFPTDIQTLHCVLTYATPLYDWKKANLDFTYFRSKLKHKYKFLEYLQRYLNLRQKVQCIYIY